MNDPLAKKHVDGLENYPLGWLEKYSNKWDLLKKVVTRPEKITLREMRVGAIRL